MSDDRQWLVLCECNNTAELHVLRATLEAHGLPCQVQGEHTHSVLGPIHGAISRPRVLVPRGGIALARELAADIVGPFDSAAPSQDEMDRGSPYRGEPKPHQDSRPGVDATQTRKSFGVLVLGLFLVFPPFLGLTHLYAGRRVTAGILASASVVLVASGSNPWLALVWIVDVVGGGLAIASHNRQVRALVDAREALEPDDDDDDDDDNGPDDDDGESPRDEHPVWRALRRLRTGSTE